MNRLFCVVKREIRGYAVAPMTYILLNGFVCLAGFIFFSLLGNFNKALHEYAGMAASLGKPPPTLNGFVAEGFGHSLVLLIVFAIPLLVMRLFSDERKGGVEELLFASPLTSAELVVGKYIALALLLVTALVAASVFPLLLVMFGNPELAPILSGLTGVALITLFFLAVGVLCASFAENHATAGIVCFVTLLFLYMSHSYVDAWDAAQGSLVLACSPLWQAGEFLKGVISLGGFLYFIAGACAALCCAITVVDMRRA
jgi:ABC-2 type transport system permease protein